MSHHPAKGRLAPSPTGAQHVGNARTYLIAWLSARSPAGAGLALRIEDIDSPRVKPGAAEQAIERPAAAGSGSTGTARARWCRPPACRGTSGRSTSSRGRTWSTPAPAPGPTSPPRPARRTPGRKAPPTPAPVPTDQPPPRRGWPRPGRRSPGGSAWAKCPLSWTNTAARSGSTAPRSAETSWSGRWRERRRIVLAVVVDDAAMGVTEVIRGDDLIPSTPRGRSCCTGRLGYA